MKPIAGLLAGKLVCLLSARHEAVKEDAKRIIDIAAISPCVTPDFQGAFLTEEIKSIQRKKLHIFRKVFIVHEVILEGKNSTLAHKISHERHSRQPNQNTKELPAGIAFRVEKNVGRRIEHAER